jgi:hypothetical protein
MVLASVRRETQRLLLKLATDGGVIRLLALQLTLYMRDWLIDQIKIVGEAFEPISYI